MEESISQRADRILTKLQAKYPTQPCYDLDGRALHFVCEVEPVSEHSEYDRAVEVIISSKPHMHHKMTQWYTVLNGTLNLHIDDRVVVLKAGDKYMIKPNQIHWATSEDEATVELYSEPGWTKEDHIVVN